MQMKVIPFEHTVQSTAGTSRGFGVLEVLFQRELTESEQERVNKSFPEPFVLDWRDGSTLWVWESQSEMERFHASIEKSFGNVSVH